MTVYNWNGGTDFWTDPDAWTPNGVTLWNVNDTVIFTTGTVVLHDIEPNGLQIRFGGSSAATQPDMVLDNAALGPQTYMFLPPQEGTASFATLTVQGWDTVYGAITLGGKEISPGILTVNLPQTGYGQLNQDGTIAVLDSSFLSISGPTAQQGVFNNDGTLLIAGATAVINSAVTGAGAITLEEDPGYGPGQLILGGPVGPHETVNMTAGRLTLNDPMQFLATIGSWNDPQSPVTVAGMDLVSAVFQQTTPDVGDLLLFGKNGPTPVLDLKVAGQYGAHAFGVTDDPTTHSSVIAIIPRSGPPSF